MYLADDSPPAPTAPETLEARDARRTLIAMIGWGVAVAAIFYIGYKQDPPNKDHLLR